jgi:hypothetical protein
MRPHGGPGSNARPLQPKVKVAQLSARLSLTLKEVLLFAGGAAASMTITSDWPSALPAAIVSGYREQPSGAFSRSDMDNGYARQRRRFTSYPMRVVATWVFTAVEWELFSAWYDFGINGGATSFSMPVAAGQSFQTSAVRFADPETPWEAEALSGGGRKVSAVLELFQRPTISRMELWSRLHANR